MVAIVGKPGKLWLLLWILWVSPAAARHLELLIIGPGDNPYTLYGHSAMLLVEGAEPTDDDLVFNFGVTDFKRPNYVLNFVGGRVHFWGKSVRWGKVLRRWIKHDRAVWRWPINLEPRAVEIVVASMRHDIKPEHREYIYDAFRNNCATRLRDYLDQATGGAVFAALGQKKTGRSFRDDIREAYSHQPELLLMTELVPGVELDTDRTAWALAYRPHALAASLASVTYRGRPLIGPAVQIYRRQGPNTLDGPAQRGQIFLSVLAGLILLLARVAQRLSRRWRGVFLGIWATLSGGAGVVLWAVTAYTACPDLQHNWLSLTFIPFDFAVWWTAICVFRGKTIGPVVRWYLGVRVILTGVILLAGLGLTSFRGPIPPRLLALAGIVLALACVGATRKGLAKS